MLKRILVLDDNEDILSIVHETLAYEQFEVRSTMNPDEVLPLVKEFQPDVIILDYRVGGTNGGELCRNIKADPLFGDIPVIIFSAYVNKDSEILAYGCDAVINKPFNLDEFVGKIKDLIED